MSTPAAGPPDPARGRRILLLLGLVAISPIVASYVAYYWFVPTKRVNYGELLDPRPAPALAGTHGDGTPFALAELRGKWVLLVATGPGCDEPCRRALYATRQARTIQGREQDRVERLWLRPATAGPPVQADAQPGLIVARVDSGALAGLPLVSGAEATILILDPRGNLVLRYGPDPDIRKLANDLGRLLRASQIG